MKSASLVLDRHAFASNASSFDTAWRTFGCTPSILERTGSLEETVPWATAAARADDPPRLRGRAEVVLHPANFDRLQFAFLPQDGRLGFSVWGATERVRGAPEWRVLTHTLLFDADAFDQLAGFPFALLRDSEYDAWFRAMIACASFNEPAPLEPVVVPASAKSRARFEQARLREIARLRELLISAYGQPELLERRLAAVYQALAEPDGSSTYGRVALRSCEGHTEQLVVRLAWISLPLAERASIFFSTEQRKMERPPATLFVMTDAEWGRYVPHATRVLGPDSALYEDHVSPGRAYWAATIVRDPTRHRTLVAAADRRGWCLIRRDDLGRIEALRRWRNRGPAAGSYDAARELVAIETDPATASARLRARGIGHVVACACIGDPQDPLTRASRAGDVLRILPPHAEIVALRGAVRTLARGTVRDQQTGAFLRLAATYGDVNAKRDESMRLLDAEASLVPPLLQHADGPLALFRAARDLAFRGHLVSERLAGLAVRHLGDPLIAIQQAIEQEHADDPRVVRWLVSVLRLVLTEARALSEVIARIVDVWPASILLHDEILGRVVGALSSASENGSAAAAAELASRLSSVILDATNGHALSAMQVTALLRLSWIELLHGRRATALERHGAEYPHAAVPLLVQLLVSTPPLPLYLRIRRMLLRLPQSHLDQPELEPWRAALREISPALHARMSRERYDDYALAYQR